MFKNFEFGIYYFTRGINIINDQITGQKLNDNVKNFENKIITREDIMEIKMNETITKLKGTKIKLDEIKMKLTESINFSKEMLSLFQLLNNENLNEKVKELKKKYNITDLIKNK